MSTNEAHARLKTVFTDHSVKYRDARLEEIVSETKYEGDRYNLGKVALKNFQRYPDKVYQIDAGTGEQETNGSLRVRLLACCRLLTELGVKRGDILALTGMNHLDICVPYIASFCLGITVLPIDPNLIGYELNRILRFGKPCIVFCDSDKVAKVATSLKDISQESHIVAFKHGDVAIEAPALNFTELITKYSEEADSFELPSFDTDDTIALVVFTSGTTGQPKAIEHTYRNLIFLLPYVWSDYQTFPTPTKMVLMASPIHGIMAVICMIQGFIYNLTRVQTSTFLTAEHSFYIINKYKPNFFICTFTYAHMLMTHPGTEDCDFSCFERFYVGGSAVQKNLLENLRRRIPYGKIGNAYGMSEVAALVFITEDETPMMSIGKPIKVIQYKLIDNDGNEILEPNKTGELLIKGGNLFKGYHDEENSTDDTITSDGFFRTGDLMYRDKDDNYYYVERIKLLIKYKSYQIFPQELEEVIMTHPGVDKVVVCGIPHEADMEHAAACVVRAKNEHGEAVTAQEIKDLIKNTLSPNYQLLGGVLFLEEIPIIASGKLDRRTAKKMLLEAKPE